MNAKERFLLWFLAALIGSQIVFLGWGIHWCGQNGGLEACPEISKRYETTFNVAIATVLALLTGSVISSPRRSSSDDRDASALLPLRQPQQPTLETISEEPVQASGRPVQDQVLEQQVQPSSPSSPVSPDRASRKG